MLKKIIILKKLSHILRIGLLGGLWLFSSVLLAQTNPVDSSRSIATDSSALSVASDSISIEGDSVLRSSNKKLDSLQTRNEKGDIETTIFYHAEDSIMMDVPNKKAYLYGKAQIKYKEMQIDAEQIEIKWDQNIIKARGRVDSTGKYIGHPVFKQGPSTYETDSMRYNMKTQKGIIHGIVTKQGEGYLHGDTAKRTPDAIYLKNGIYTTCDRKHPHFYINARKLKVIPDDKAVTGPFNLVIEDIPTPIGFWMGFFPITDKKKSGIVFPAFGESQQRGLYISRGGYYWAVNDYLSVQVLADIFANGSVTLNGNATYLKRYKFRGSSNLTVGRSRDGFEKTDPVRQQFSLNWQHSTMAKRNGTFSATVNLSSSKMDKIYNNTPSRTNNTTSSSVTYSRVLGRTPFSTTISLRANQNNSAVTASNNQSAIYNVTLPSASLTMARINPLKRKYGSGNKWYEKVFMTYQSNFTYDLTNNQKFYDPISKSMQDSALKVNSENLTKYIIPNSRWSSTHSATLGSSFKLFKYFNANPTFNNFFNLYGKKLTYQYDTAYKRSTVVDTTNGFYNTYYMNLSLEVNTRIYGTKEFKGNGVIKGIRHTLNPSVTMRYAPDFSQLPSGGYMPVEGDVDREGKTKRYFQYFNNPTPPFKQAALDFKITNVLEAKVRNRKDTTGTNKYKKINLLDNFSIDGGYNFAADSLKMRNININAKTKLFGKFDITFTSILDPYAHQADSIWYYKGQKIAANDRQINVYRINYDGKLAQIQTMNLTITTRFAPKKKSAVENAPKFNNPDMQSELDYIKAHPEQYVDFNVPWSLALSFTNNYRKNGLNDPVITQAITANGDISLTPNWKIIYSTGYNFKDQAITYSNFTISRDLHCWQMNMTLSPFGSYRTFMFTISAKSAMLQQLKLNKRAPSLIY